MRKILKRLFALFVVAVLVYSGCKLLTYMLQDDTASQTRLMMHELYNQKNIDYLFVGTSHFVDGINPFLISEKTGKDVFSASSSGQTPDVSLALVREAVSLYSIDEVFLEINSVLAEDVEVFKDRSTLTQVYIVSDYLRPSLNKLELLLNASSESHYVNSFWPARRYWEFIADYKKIDSVLQKKSTDKYKDHTYYFVNTGNDDVFEYRGNGYTANYHATKDHEFLSRDPEISANFSFGDTFNTYKKIIELCLKNNIKLTLVNPPVSNFGLTCVNNYDVFLEYITELRKAGDIGFIDVNLVSNDYFPYKQTNFMDWHHLNDQGADQFSTFLADYINNDIPESVFYDSLSDKLRSCPTDFYGIFYQDDYENKERVFHLISNDPGYYEYKIDFISGSGDLIPVQDYSVNDKVRIPYDLISGCELVVYFRQAGSAETGEQINYRYMEPVY